MGGQQLHSNNRKLLGKSPCSTRGDQGKDVQLILSTDQVERKAETGLPDPSTGAT